MNQKLSSLISAGRGALDDVSRHTRSRDWRSRLARWVPFLLSAGFLGLLAMVLGERLLPAREVTIDSVVTIGGAGNEVAGARGPAPEIQEDVWEATMLFQASGWVEPDPLPIKATALVDGVVETVAVLEGETVTAGQLLATLIDEDFELDLRTARSRLAALQAQTAGHHQQMKITEAEIATLDKEVAALEARRSEFVDLNERYETLKDGSISQREITQAKLQLATQEAEIAALAATEQELRGRLGQLTEIAKDFEARIAEANTDVDRKALALERTRVKSPVDGVVLRLLAVPGQKRMLGMDDPDSATIAILYQPDKLQARIDVPLEEAAKLAIGQPVRLRSSFLPDRTFKGSVTRIVGEADLQRNTLQAKVRILDPDPRLRPEMLCRAEFLAAAAAGPSKQAGGDGAAPLTSVNGRVRIFVPAAALIDVSGDSATVWAIDNSGHRLVKKPVTLGQEQRDTHRLVVEGLQPGDRVVLDPPAGLEPGERVRAAASSNPSTASSQ